MLPSSYFREPYQFPLQAPGYLLRQTVEPYITKGVPWWAERNYRRKGDFLVDSTGQAIFYPYGKQWRYQTPFGPYVLRRGEFYPLAAAEDQRRWRRRLGTGRGGAATPMLYSMLTR